MKIIQNINSQLFTSSAFVIGMLLSEDLSVNEQNSLGNWFMLIGQVLETNSSQQQLINNRDNEINDNQIENDSYSTQHQINMIKKVIFAMEKEINNLKNQ